MSNPDDFPTVPKELLDKLEAMNPDKVPEIEWSDRQIWIEVGKCSVVRFLRHQYEKQNENILKGKTI